MQDIKQLFISLQPHLNIHSLRETSGLGLLFAVIRLSVLLIIGNVMFRFEYCTVPLKLNMPEVVNFQPYSCSLAEAACCHCKLLCKS